jgi:hypothetical protein
MRWFLILPRLGARLYWMAALRQEQTSANSIFLIFEQKRTAGAGWSAFGVAAIVGAGLCVAASLSALSLIAQNAPGN